MKRRTYPTASLLLPLLALVACTRKVDVEHKNVSDASSGASTATDFSFLEQIGAFVLGEFVDENGNVQVQEPDPDSATDSIEEPALILANLPSAPSLVQTWKEFVDGFSLGPALLAAGSGAGVVILFFATRPEEKEEEAAASSDDNSRAPTPTPSMVAALTSSGGNGVYVVEGFNEDTTIDTASAFQGGEGGNSFSLTNAVLGAAIDASSGDISFDFSAVEAGVHTLTVVVTDSEGQTANATFALTYEADALLTVGEGTEFVAGTPATITISLADLFAGGNGELSITPSAGEVQGGNLLVDLDPRASDTISISIDVADFDGDVASTTITIDASAASPNDSISNSIFELANDDGGVLIDTDAGKDVIFSNQVVASPTGNVVSVSFIGGAGADVLSGNVFRAPTGQLDEVVLAGGEGDDVFMNNVFADADTATVTIDGGSGADTVTLGGGLTSFRKEDKNFVVTDGAAEITLIDVEVLISHNSLLRITLDSAQEYDNVATSSNDAILFATISQSLAAADGDDAIFGAEFVGTVTVDGGDGTDSIQLGEYDSYTVTRVNGTVVVSDSSSRVFLRDFENIYFDNTVYAPTLVGNSYSANISLEGTSYGDLVYDNVFDGTFTAKTATIDGGAGDDRFVGNKFTDAHAHLLGGAGDDRFITNTFVTTDGALASATIDGGEGIDTVQFGALTDYTVVESAGLVTVTDARASVVLQGIEQISASDGDSPDNDFVIHLATLTLDGATLSTGATDDVIYGATLSQTVTIDGEEGNDSIHFGNFGDYTVQHAAGIITVSDAAAERHLANIEGVYFAGLTYDGSRNLQSASSNSTITGLAEADIIANNTFSTGDATTLTEVAIIADAGNDLITSNVASSDGDIQSLTFMAGEGDDSIIDNTFSSGLGVRYLGLVGGDGDDTISGNVVSAEQSISDLTISGGDGDDTITSNTLTVEQGDISNITFAGGAGNDLFSGNVVRDVNTASVTLDGGSGSDTARFLAQEADYTITHSPTKKGIVTASDAETEWVLQNIETIAFADSTILFANLTSDAGNLSGSEYDDAIYGVNFVGRVTIDGAAGQDSLYLGYQDNYSIANVNNFLVVSEVDSDIVIERVESIFFAQTQLLLANLTTDGAKLSLSSDDDLIYANSISNSVTIDGGEGYDTVFLGAYADYSVSKQSGTVTASDTVADIEIVNTELLMFGERELHYATLTVDGATLSAGDADAIIIGDMLANTVTIDGGGGNNTLELGDYANYTVTRANNTVTVSATDGQAEIHITNIDTLLFGEFAWQFANHKGNGGYSIAISTLAALFDDVESAGLSYNATNSSKSNASGAISDDNTALVFTGTDLIHGTNTLTITARDGSGDPAATRVLEVGVDKTVVTTSITVPANETVKGNGDYNIAIATIAALFDDVESAGLSYNATNGSNNHAQVMLTEDGSNLVFAGSELIHGTNTLTITARDGSDDTATRVLEVGVDKTVVTTSISVPASTVVDGNGDYNIAIATIAALFDDVEDAGLRYNATNGSNNNAQVMVTKDDSNLVFTGSELIHGTNTLTITARDGSGDTAPRVLEVRVDKAVVTTSITVPTSTFVDGNGDYTIAALFDDVEDAGLSYTVTNSSNNDAQVVVTEDGSNLVFTGSDLIHGTNTLTITATDGSKDTAIRMLEVRVDKTVVNTSITVPDSEAVDGNGDYTIAIATIAALFDDVEDAGLIYAVTNGSNNDALGIMNAGKTAFVFTGTDLIHGANTLTIKATDGSGDTATRTLSVMVDKVLAAGAIPDHIILYGSRDLTITDAALDAAFIDGKAGGLTYSYTWGGTTTTLVADADLVVNTSAAHAPGGTETLTVTATDSSDDELSREFVISIAAAPTLIDTKNLGVYGFIIQGDVVDDGLGWSVSAAGDVNGDGYADLIVGAYDDGGSDAGEAYVIWGKSDAFGNLVGSRRVLDTTNLGDAGFIIQSDATEDYLDISVSAAGDVNGDGYADLIVGASGGDDGGSSAGEAYVIWGKSGAFGSVVDTTNLGDAGFIIQGDAAGDDFGYSVSAAGDVNGDGYADLIVGARYGDDGGSNAGEAYVIWGQADKAYGTLISGRRVVDTSSFGDAGFIIQGDAAGDGLGWSVSAAGDVNGDGYADLIVGAYDDDATDAGEAYVIWGKSGKFTSVVDTTSLGNAGFIIQGDAAGDDFGYSVSAAGDVNGDGYADLIIGSRNGDDGGTSAGEAYVILGKSTFGSVVETTNLDDDGFIIQGDATSDELGWSVSAAGDVNGDGYADLIVGARYGDDGAIDAGEAYVIWGKSGEFGSLVGSRRVVDTSNLGDAGIIIQGDAADDFLGRSVSAAGDVNDDGYADLIVGASGGDDGGTDAGEAYVIWGGAHLSGYRLGYDPDATNQPRREFDADVELTDYFFDFSNLFINASGTLALSYNDTESDSSNANGNGATVGVATWDASTNLLSIDLSEIDEDFDIIITGTDDDGDTAIWRMAVAAKPTNVNAEIPDASVGDSFASPYTGADITINLRTVFAGGYGTLGYGTSLGSITNGMLTIPYSALQEGNNTISVTATDTDGDAAIDVFVLSKSSLAVSAQIDTTSLGKHGFIIQGDAAGDEFGYSVSAAGDVNNDGYADLIVGAPGGGNTGEAYVIWGKSDGFGSLVGSRRVVDTTNLGDAGFIIQGDAPADYLGSSVSAAGDVNGDGFADLIVGADWGDDGGNTAGEAYVIWGKSGATRADIDTTNLGTAGFIIQGDAAGDELGWSVSAAGDVNGDGYADLIVGAYNGDDGGKNAGEAYVIWGKSDTFGTKGSDDRWVVDTTNLGDAGFIIQGNAADDEFGGSVSAAGDVNGDGYADLFVGANYGNDAVIAVTVSDDDVITVTVSDAGEAYVIWGKAGETRADIDTTSLGDAGFIIQGDAAYDELGYSVSAAGDVNGDGYADMIVGARYGDDGGNSAGEAYVIWGQASKQYGTKDSDDRWVVDTTSLGVAGFIIQGDAAYDQLGYSVSAAGDVNGDGYADLIVGARYGNDGGPDAGEAYVIWGQASKQYGTKDSDDRWVVDTTNLGDAGFIIRGDVANDELGRSVSAAGDVNNDGYADLIVGAHVGNDGGTDAGEAYVIWGGAHLSGYRLGFDPDAADQPKREFDADVELTDYTFDFSDLFTNANGTLALSYSDTESDSGNANGNGATVGAATWNASTNLLSIDLSEIDEDFDISITATDDDGNTALWRIEVFDDGT